jgi:16S rRNA (uracil1498-N3)-methyltransferase
MTGLTRSSGNWEPGSRNSRAGERKAAKRRRRKKGNPPAMDRILIDRVAEINQEVIIEGPPLEALRFQGGRRSQIVTLTDADGKDFRARVLQLSATKASLLIFDRFPSPTESGVEIVLLQALPEKERMEWIIQKTTELGVSTLIPFKSVRSISLEEREAKQKKAHRWQEVAVKAVQQSRRAWVPRIEAYRSFSKALDACEGEGLKILLWEKTGEPLKQVMRQHNERKIFAMVGPEGGFTEEEVAEAGDAGFIPVKLGQRILRTETAAIVLVALLQYERGDLG